MVERSWLVSTKMRGSKQGYARFISALLLGLVVGAVSTRMVGVWRSSGKGAEVPAGWVKESDLPPGTLAGLSEQQKRNVLKVITERSAARPPAQQPRMQEDAKAVYRVPLDDSPVKGPADALVTIVESSDFECPFCKRVQPTLKQIADTYPEKVRLVFKQNPLPSHPNALPAAIAAEEARAQGGDSKFWAMHDKLFEQSPALERPDLEKAAQELRLDLGAFRRALDGKTHQARIERDQALMRGLGATGTPIFFINGRKLAGAQPIEAFKRIIDEEVGKAEAMVKQGVKPEAVYAKIMEKAAEGIARAPSAPPTQPASPSPPSVAKKIDIPPDSPVLGAKTAKVTIVEWSDFQCPFCGRAVPTLKKIEETYGKDVRVVFRHLPLPMHSNAKLAAEASMAAHAQGKFWQYHDKLFANQNALERPALESYAGELGLDAAKFKAALDGGTFRSKVESDAAAGGAVGATGTPTFFINGRQLFGAMPFETFKPIIDEEIAKASKLLAAGTKPEKLYEKLLEQNVASAGDSAKSVKKIDIASAPVKGPKNAPVTIVEFSDFQCPFCGRAVPTLRTIEEQYGNKVKVAFKNQPLPMHPNARPAAAAAMAANEQGKFWEYHDKLFANQQALDRASLEKYAAEVGLDMPKFKAALDTNKFEPRITADVTEATRAGVDGAPTFFINGRELVGAQPVEAFKAIIDDELKKADMPANEPKKTAKK